MPTPEEDIVGIRKHVSNSHIPRFHGSAGLSLIILFMRLIPADRFILIEVASLYMFSLPIKMGLSTI